MKEQLWEFNRYTGQLVLTMGCTAVVWQAAVGLVGIIINHFAPGAPTWPIYLFELVGASAGLYFLTKNGKKKK